MEILKSSVYASIIFLQKDKFVCASRKWQAVFKISRLKNELAAADNLQQAVKIAMNSLDWYGAW